MRLPLLRQPRDRSHSETPTTSPTHPARLPTADSRIDQIQLEYCDDAETWRHLQDVTEKARSVQQAFEAVQNKQHPFGAEIPDQLLSRIICPAERKAQGVGDGGRQQTSRRDANKRNEIDAVLEYVD